MVSLEMRDTMMPLTYAESGSESTIVKIGGKPEVKKHLENLGFIAGSTVSVITQQNGNVIVKVKEARVAISKEMANKIFV
jgi:ferrous iron transport protein A